MWGHGHLQEAAKGLGTNMPTAISGRMRIRLDDRRTRISSKQKNDEGLLGLSSPLLPTTEKENSKQFRFQAVLGPYAAP